jgi:hypothetical protein
VLAYFGLFVYCLYWFVHFISLVDWLVLWVAVSVGSFVLPLFADGLLVGVLVCSFVG